MSKFPDWWFIISATFYVVGILASAILATICIMIAKSIFQVNKKIQEALHTTHQILGNVHHISEEVKEPLSDAVRNVSGITKNISIWAERSTYMLTFTSIFKGVLGFLKNQKKRR